MILGEERISALRKLIRKGMPSGEVKELLVKEGYPAEEIQKVFKPRPYDMRSWLLFFSILLALTGAFLFITRPDRPILFLGLSASLFLAYFGEVQRKRKEI